jgi:hypothetical protein
MIHVLLPYYPSDVSFHELALDILNQKEPWKLLTVDAQKEGWLFTRCMQEFYQRAQSLPDDDIICILNTDLSFGRDFFTVATREIRHGRILIPKVYEDGKLIDGGIEVDWSKKSFKFGERIDCFSPRGIFITVKDFKESGGFHDKLLPHYMSDYDWSFRQIARGIKPINIGGLIVIHRHHENKKTFVLSRLNVANPICWTFFLFLNCPKKHLFINLLRAWCDAIRKI